MKHDMTIAGALPRGLVLEERNEYWSKLPSFWKFLIDRRVNRRYMQIAILGSILQFLIFKILYPFPDFISDSSSYIATNEYNMAVNLWPIGYSKFLLLIHTISHSDTLVVGIQYTLMQITLIYFFYTFIYLYRPAKNSTLILFIFLFFNPMFIYLSNSILSDALFTSLSLIFLAQFLWMLHKPNINQILLQGIIIGLAFTIRYTAIYYPIISIIGFVLSRQRIYIKLLGIGLGMALMIPFYLYTQQKTKEITGSKEFSVFGGWQLANNALYMYQHINVDSNRLPANIRPLDRMSKKFFSLVHPSSEELASLPGTYFIKVPYGILKPYMSLQYSYTDPPGQFKAWGMVSPIYNQYGVYLIMHHPISFAQYYLWMNTKNYFLPHLEKFGTYNVETNTVSTHVQDWFDYVSPEVYAVSITLQGRIFHFYPVLFLILNLYFITYLIYLAARNKLKTFSEHFKLSILFISGYLLINFLFSIFATPVVLRYQIIPMVLLFSFSLLLLEFPDNKHQLRTNQQNAV